MPKHIISIALVFLNLSLCAQKIPARLSLWPEAPVVFELPAQHKAIFLFFAIVRNEAVVQAVETDSAFATLRQAAAPPVRRGELDAFMYVVGWQADTAISAYFIIDDTDIWHYELRLSDFSIRNEKILTLSSKEYLLGGFVRGGKCGLLARRTGKKDSGQLLLYDDLSAGKPPRETTLNGAFHLLDKLYRPVVTGSALEHTPQQLTGNPAPAYWNEAMAGFHFEQPAHRAAAADKIWFGRDAIWFSSDIPIKTPNGKVPAVELSALRWDDLSFRTDTLHFTDVPNGAYNPQQGTHTVFDDKLFSLYIRDDVMALRVRELASGRTLWQEELPASPDTLRFFNSPVLLPKGISRREKEVLTADKFIAGFLKFAPFLQVRRGETGYVLSMGGIQAGGNSPGSYTPGTPSVNTPHGTVAGTPGGWSGPNWSLGGWGDLPTYTSSFYVVLDANGDTIRHRPDIRFSNTLQGLMAGKVENKEGKRNGAGLFRLFGQYWFGYYVQKERGYFMDKLDPDAD